MDTYHTHHIIPRHMGGTDDPSNLVRLTVEEHAAAHLKLYEEHSNKLDYVAWKCLSGQISPKEASTEAWKIGRERGTAHLRGKTYEEAYGEEGAKMRKQQIADGNRKRKGIKYKSMNRTICPNSHKVCCIACQKETSLQGLGHHKKKCF